MIKVLRILNRFNLGGPVYNASYLTSDLSSDFETMLIGGPHEDGEADALYIAHQLGLEPVVIEEMRRSVNPIQDLRALQRIREIIKEFKPDIVHTHASKAGALGRIAARLERVPVVVHTYHGHVFHSYFGSIKTSIYKIIERTLAKFTTAIVTISPHQRIEICDIHRIVDSKKAHVIPLGFDLQRFDVGNDERRKTFRIAYQLEEEEVAIAIVGRLVPIKNHSLLIRAVGAMKEKSIRLFIVGDGPEKTALTTLCDALQLTHSADNQIARVQFIGWHKRIENILPGFDIVALSSDNEGTPVSLIEAQSAKLPVISTNVGGVSDIVAHGKTGLIVPPKDLPALISALEQLISDKEQRICMGEEGQKAVLQAFSKERLARDMSALYRSLL